MAHSKAHILFENAAGNIQQYNRFCLHYNLVADAIYRELHRSRTPFSPDYEPYLIASLISFDMERMMGEGLAQRYDVTAEGFAARLHRKLEQVQPFLTPIISSSLVETDIEKCAHNIVAAYDAFAAGGEDGLHEQNKAFHVGATKIMHFLNPELFAIVDSNTAKVLKRLCDIPYQNTTQPGYSGEMYVRSLCGIQNLIAHCGVEQFRSLEIGTPVLRIFDKLAFAFNAFTA